MEVPELRTVRVEVIDLFADLQCVLPREAREQFGKRLAPRERIARRAKFLPQGRDAGGSQRPASGGFSGRTEAWVRATGRGGVMAGNP
jgi:hypothetical protein